MRFNASSGACSSDVLIELAEPLRVRSAPVTGAAVSGVCVAVVAAALIYMCYRKRVIITAPVRTHHCLTLHLNKQLNCIRLCYCSHYPKIITKHYQLRLTNTIIQITLHLKNN